jgi:hypothetical protein
MASPRKKWPTVFEIPEERTEPDCLDTREKQDVPDSLLGSRQHVVPGTHLSEVAHCDLNVYSKP